VHYGQKKVLAPQTSHKTYGGGIRIAPLIVTLMERGGQRHVPATLTPVQPPESNECDTWWAPGPKSTFWKSHATFNSAEIKSPYSPARGTVP
jgi:hypothetical protein